MKKGQKKGAVFAMICTALFVDLHLVFASSLSWTGKLAIIALAGLGQLAAIWGILHMKPWPQKAKVMKEKKVFDLSVKLYGLLLFSASSIYTVGIWLASPADKFGIKDWVLGIALAIQVFIVLFFALKKTKEEPDERFYINLSKSAALMFVLVLTALLLLAAALVFWGRVTLHMGLVFIVIAALVSIFSVVYFILEKRG